MFLVGLMLWTQFSTGYKEFVRSPQSESVFVNLVRGDTKLVDYAENPVVLWYWRSNTGSAEADSLLSRINMPRNQYLSAVLRLEARNNNDLQFRYDKLKLAVHFDTASIENFASLIALGIQKRNLDPIKLAVSMPILSDFSNQVLIISNFLLLLFAAFFLAGFIYIVIKMVYYMPALGHRLIPIKHGQLADIIRILILLTPVLIIRNLYLIYLIYGLLLIPVMERREKNWLRVNIITLLLLFIAFMPVNNLIGFLTDYGREYQYYELVNHDTFREMKVSNVQEKEMYAYALKKQTKLEQAQGLYENLYYDGFRNTAIANNLGNIYHEYEEYALAESLYQNACRYGESPIPYFNLGLLKLRLIEYVESSRYMDEARNRGFSSDSKTPIDIAPTNTDFYRWTMGEELKTEGKIHTILIIPFVILFLLSFIPLKFTPPYYCSSCGRPICKTCTKEVESETICEECFNKFKSTGRQEIEADLRQAVSYHRQRLNNITKYLLNLLIPGGGLVFTRKHFAGLIFIFIALVVYIPLLMPGIFISPTGWLILPIKPIFFLNAVVLIVISYIITYIKLIGE